MVSGTVILADGNFPKHEIPLGILRNAERIICCDGAALPLLQYGLEPFAIVGDCDSLTPEIESKYSNLIFRSADQETNDLTKSVKWCSEHGYDDLFILGATGKREDHTIGNISLLVEYASFVRIKMITDTGILYPVLSRCSFETICGQQVSIFSTDPATEITANGLKYPLNRKKLGNWWEATLNEATGNLLELEFEGGPLIIFLKFIP